MAGRKSRNKNVKSAQPERVKSFTQFRKLPIELRYRIWDMAMEEEERIIEVHGKTEKNDAVVFFSTTPTPIFMRVSQESRDRALRVYELITPRWFDPLQTFQTYINYRRDTLYFALPHFDKSLRAKPRFIMIQFLLGVLYGLQIIQSLAFSVDFLNDSYQSNLWMCRFLDYCRSVSKVHLVYGDYCCASGPGGYEANHHSHGQAVSFGAIHNGGQSLSRKLRSSDRRLTHNDFDSDKHERSLLKLESCWETHFWRAGNPTGESRPFNSFEIIPSRVLRK